MAYLRFAKCWLVATLVLAIVRASAQDRPGAILVLVSFDGWRWDYMDRANVPHLRALAARGVRAEGLIPTFPSKTFPNHYSIVTGLYPEHHGVVGNNMVDPAFPERFSMSAATARDARWWGGEPLWVTAIRQGRLAASMFWPGSEAPIRGVRPTYWRRFDDDVPNRDRVRQVLDWLALPPAERPSFVTLYFSETDDAGHDYGPESAEVRAAAAHLDEALGDLIAGIEKLDLLKETSFVVVSDHGMSQLDDSRVIFLDDFLDMSKVDVVELTPTLAIAPKSGSVDQLYRALKGAHPSLAVYKRADIPRGLHYRRNPRIAPVVALADDGWTITTHAQQTDDKAAGRRMGGMHGYDPRNKSMHGLFVAAGPKVRSGVVVHEFENIHIYDFVCRLLGLTPAPNDGNPRALRSALKPEVEQ